MVSTVPEIVMSLCIPRVMPVATQQAQVLKCQNPEVLNAKHPRTIVLFKVDSSSRSNMPQRRFCDLIRRLNFGLTFHKLQEHVSAIPSMVPVYPAFRGILPKTHSLSAEPVDTSTRLSADSQTVKMTQVWNI